MSKELFEIFKLKDPYLNYNNTYLRLEGEYFKYNSLVIAYDFDDTVYDFHNKGRTYENVISLLQTCKENNCHMICFTGNQDIKFVKEYLNKFDIPYDGINENPPFWNSSARKIYYNALLDDRAGLLETFNHLSALMNKVELNKEFKEKTLS